MARALWSGAIAFGLVNIPVKLYGATESKDLSFTTLHASCMTALKRPYICPKDNVPVDQKDMVKGYEFAKGQYVILIEPKDAVRGCSDCHHHRTVGWRHAGDSARRAVRLQSDLEFRWIDFP